MALLEETGADCCSAGLEVLIDDRVFPRRGVEGVLRYRDLLRNRHMEAFMGTAMVRLDAFWGSIGPLDELIPGGYAEDFEWMLRAAANQPVPVIPDPLVRMRWIVRSHFRDQWPDWEAALGQILAQHPDFAREPRGKAHIEGQIAVAIAAQGRRRDAPPGLRTWRTSRSRADIALAVVAACRLTPCPPR